MKTIFENYKTTIVGGLLVVAGVTLCAIGKVTEGTVVLLNGVGMILAKDHDKN